MNNYNLEIAIILMVALAALALAVPVMRSWKVVQAESVIDQERIFLNVLYMVGRNVVLTDKQLFINPRSTLIEIKRIDNIRYLQQEGILCIVAMGDGNHNVSLTESGFELVKTNLHQDYHRAYTLT